MNFKLNIKHINKIQNLLVTWAHFKYYKKKILKKQMQRQHIFAETCTVFRVA
jgi:hypothetical protein